MNIVSVKIEKIEKIGTSYAKVEAVVEMPYADALKWAQQVCGVAGPLSSVPAASAVVPASTEAASGSVAPAASTEGNGRRGRRGAASTVDAGATAAPAPNDGGTSETASAPVSDEGNGGGRRRRGGGASVVEPVQAASGGASAASQTGDEELTDADVLKECSAAAQHILPAGVKEIMALFMVDHVGELSQAQRPKFLAALDKAVEKAKG